MADASGIGLALAYCCATVLYPDGLSGVSVTGRQTVVRRGWLLPSDLFTAESVRNEINFVTATIASSRNEASGWAEPLGQPWEVLERISPTVSVSREDGETVRIIFPPDGTEACGVVGLWLDDGSAGALASCAVAVKADDTVAGVASVLAGMLEGAVAQGDTVWVPGHMLQGRMAGYGQSVQVSRRQAQRYRVSVWTADAMVREGLSSTLDTALAGLNWITTLDGRSAQLRFLDVQDVDTMQNQAIYRRDFLYEIVFDTLQVCWAADMLFGVGTGLWRGSAAWCDG
ncbi:hypothetical protein [Gluconobacter morbifer]|uniref:Uncharacterized protein n=1 Tax=Gluconobacter morbifer G707 TaxID=1088869 RepID=G6XMB4_9PROT|nr:hypothetical protein [Gluconobacter morbifer]EHH67012.1 hypothetical protein GMO_26320 [Gluconobacter morbifer G707]